MVSGQAFRLPAGIAAVREVILNNLVISSEQIFYDILRRPIKYIVKVLSNGSEIRDYIIQKEYDVMGHVTKIIENETTFTNFEYDTYGRLIKKINSDGISIEMTYDGLGHCVSKKSSDGSIDYKFAFNAFGNLALTQDQVTGNKCEREFDLFGRLIKDSFLNGYNIEYEYDYYNRPIAMLLPNLTKVEYVYDPYNLKKIIRKDRFNHNLYEIICEEYDQRGLILKSSSPVGSTNYVRDKSGRFEKISSNFTERSYPQYDSCGNLMEEVSKDSQRTISQKLSYDYHNQVVEENGARSNSFNYDSIGNCISKNGIEQKINSSNQIENNGSFKFFYDVNGRLIKDEEASSLYQYDASGRLKSFKMAQNTTELIYDGLNRCASIKDGVYLKNLIYQGEKEIGSFQDNILKEFRLAHPDKNSEITFAIEIDGKTFFTEQDSRFNITNLVSDEGEEVERYNYSCFKQENGSPNDISPWRFSNRRQINHLTLFTHRYYDQNLGRWITPDPLGYFDGYNLYKYTQNNSYKYFDRDGKFAIAIAAAIEFTRWAITAYSLPTVATCVAATATAATIYYAPKVEHKWFGTHYSSQVFYPGYYVLNSETLTLCDEEPKTETPAEVEEIEFEGRKYPLKAQPHGQKVVGGVYAPDRRLPNTEDGVPIPDSETPHTQLSTEVGGMKGKIKKPYKYLQTREWQYKPNTKDLEAIHEADFTDHGKPHLHNAPHKHVYSPNPSGGTPKRENGIPLEGWKY